MVVEFRSDFYNAIPQRVKDFPVTTEYPHILHRRFIVNNREPNEVYRHWLETNVGMQGIDWAWDISIADLSMVDIKFVDSEHAVLFELTWP